MPNNTLYQQGYGRIKPRPMTPVNFASPLGADLLYCWPFGDPWSPREVVNGGSTVKWGGPYLEFLHKKTAFKL